MSDTPPAHPEGERTLPEKLSEVRGLTWLLIALVACILLFLTFPFPTAEYARDAQAMKAESVPPPSPITPSDYALASRSTMAFRPVAANASLLSEETTTSLEALAYMDGTTSGGTPTADDATALPISRQLMQTVTMTIETEDATKAADAIVSAVETAGGYLANLTDTNHGPGHRYVMMTVRVPETTLNQSLGEIEALGNVLSKQVSTQDVTEEHVDLSSRKRNLTQTEERLLSHLSRTAALEDIILVEAELTRVREKIERIEGRLNFLNNRVRFATVNINLQSAPEKGPLVPSTSFSSMAIATSATRSLVTFLQGVWVRLIWLGVWSPVWGVLLLAVFLVHRLWNKSAQRVALQNPEEVPVEGED